MTLFFFIIALLASTASVGLAFLCFHLKTQITICEERSRATKEQLETCSADLSSMRAKSKEMAQKFNSKLQDWKGTREKLVSRMRQLSKYQDIVDAKSFANNIRIDAEALMAQAAERAEQLIIDAKAELKADQKSAKEKLKSTHLEIETSFDYATKEAERIIAVAKNKEKEIAGGAYDAMTNASSYEQTAKAMKNVIKGYGDEYIIPEESLLDDLADDFSHEKAGTSLKMARKRTKQMILNGTAAACDYVESGRRSTAETFVLDAFNGKVDTILSRVKQDNAGKLSQAIRDAYTLVNFNGKAFRDARVTELFLESRLEELKWGEITQQLAAKEREEQRHAKELIREEAKAIKEQERAIKEAAKEEELLQKALLQAREQFEHSSGKQKDLYEQKLADMEGRLQEAMERKERAKSMAQKTKKGYVYIISNIGSFGEDVYKIGLTRRDNPHDRVRELGDASVPFGFDVHAIILSDDAPALEQKLQRHFAACQVNKVNHRKEFFRVNLADVKKEIDALNLTTGVKWTMTSEAKEFRESLAIDSDPELKAAWEKRQLRLHV